MKHAQTHFMDILVQEDGSLPKIRRGIECEVCGAPYPCDKAGQEAEAGDWL